MFAVLGVNDDRHAGALGRRACIKQRADLMRVNNVGLKNVKQRSQSAYDAGPKSGALLDAKGGNSRRLQFRDEHSESFHAYDAGQLSELPSFAHQVNHHAFQPAGVERKDDMHDP